MNGLSGRRKNKSRGKKCPEIYQKNMMTLKEKGNFPKTLIKVFSKNVNPNGKLSELTLSEDEVQEILQEDYDQTIKKLFKNGKIPSPCCEDGTLRIFGHYVRGLEIPYGLVKISITRVMCSGCGKTHALLMDYMIPYIRICLHVAMYILKEYEKTKDKKGFAIHIPYRFTVFRNPPSEKQCQRLISNWINNWKQRMESLFIPITIMGKMFHLAISECIKNFYRSFMQMRDPGNYRVI